MRLGQYSTTTAEQSWCGVPTDDDTIINLSEAGSEAGLEIPRSSSEFLATWQWQRKAELALEYAQETGTGVYDADDVTRHAPVDDPAKSSVSDSTTEITPRRVTIRFPTNPSSSRSSRRR